MKFKFPLQKVLEHRKVLEDVAQRDFQEARASLSAEQVKMNNMRDQLKKAYDDAFLYQHSKSGQTTESLKQIHDFILGQKVLMEKQQAKIQEAEKLVEAMREILREKAVDYKIIEKLRERKKEEYNKDMKMRDQKEMDEISILRRVGGKI